jgi:glycosyltransferase involved in cell wall biosynthesis
MKILLIHQYYLEEKDSGGSRFNEMAKEWLESGHEVTVLAGMIQPFSGKKYEHFKGAWHRKVVQNGIIVHRCHVSEAYNVNFIGRMWAYLSFVLSSTAVGLFKVKGKFDIIIVSSPPLFVGMTAYVLSLAKSIPFVFEVRDLWPESAIDTGVVTNKLIIKMAFWFERLMYNKATLINTLTPAFQAKIIEQKGISSSKVVMLPNAADFDLSDKLLIEFDANSFKKELGFSEKFVITYVGAHGVANDLVQLLDAAEFLRDTNVVFQLIGSGMLKDSLMLDAKNRGLSNVIFRKPVLKREVFKYILASDVGVSVLKKNDTFKTIYSNKTFDYMACKKPVLLLIDGVSRKLLNNAKCGIYAEPENKSEILNVIVEFTNLPKADLELMGSNGYYYAKKYFDRNVIAQNYITSILSINNK